MSGRTSAGPGAYRSEKTINVLVKKCEWPSERKKRTAQLSAHPYPCLRAQARMQAAMGLQWWPWKELIFRYERTSLGLIYSYLGKHEFFLASHC